MARLNESESWGPDEVGRLRAAWVAEPPQISVPGLSAKPIIDILLVVADPADVQQYADAKSDVVEETLRRS